VRTGVQKSYGSPLDLPAINPVVSTVFKNGEQGIWTLETAISGLHDFQSV